MEVTNIDKNANEIKQNFKKISLDSSQPKSFNKLVSLFNLNEKIKISESAENNDSISSSSFGMRCGSHRISPGFQAIYLGSIGF